MTYTPPTIAADFGGTNQDSARNLHGEKILADRYRLMAVADGERVQGEPLAELAQLDIYTGRSRNASTVYASVWVKACDEWRSGRGSAGGYGYCKASAAAAEALQAAGVRLTSTDAEGRERRSDIGGAGESAIFAALFAMGVAMGYPLASLFITGTPSLVQGSEVRGWRVLDCEGVQA
jgi:hypothetical protein